MLIALIVQAVLSLVRLTIITFGLAGDSYEVVDNSFTITLAAMTTAAVLVMARHVSEPGPRRAWLLLALAAAANCLGDALYSSIIVITGEAQFPSIADVSYLAYYPLMLLGLLWFRRHDEPPSERLKFWLDALTTTVGGGLLCWYFLIEPMMHQEQPSALAAFVGVAYPVADLVLLLGVATVSLRATDTLGRRACYLLGASVLAFMAGDAAYSSLNVSGLYEAGSPLSLLAEAPYTVSYFLMSLAAVVEARRQRTVAAGQAPQATLSQPLSPLPYIAIVLGYGLLLWVSFGDIPESVQGVVVGAVLLTGLVVARQVVAVRESARLLMEQTARRSEARFRALVQQSSDVITIVDANGVVRYQTPSIERVFGWLPESVLGRQVIDLVHVDDRAAGRGFLEAARKRGSAGQSVEWRMKHRDGGWRHVETVAANLLDDPDVAGLVLTSRDDTERRMLADQLRHQVFHDTLTGLANRALLEDRLAHGLAHSARTTRPLAILFLDLDHFKTVNDSLGHSAGDELLVAVAQRIRRTIREEDTAARFGGDEFAVLMENVVSAEEPIRVAERLLAACRRPFIVQGRETVVGCSIGIAISEAGIESADELLRNADVAMYLGKEHGRGRYELFEAGMHTRIIERLELESDLRLAIEREEFVVFYQPIISLESDRITGLEALVRWRHPQRGLLQPAAFIPRAEETGLIVPLGFQVLRQACQDARAWQQEFPADPPLSVTVNLSVRQLDHPTCIDEIRTALDESGLPPESLVLEITESFMMCDPEAAIVRLSELKSLGVRLALDDFGTGFSSLSYLQRLPVDVLKIDRSFINGMVATGRDTSLVEAILTLGSSLRLKTVAEGIERADQLEHLRALQCTFGQGYFLSRPRDHAAIGELLRQQRAERVVA